MPAVIPAKAGIHFDFALLVRSRFVVALKLKSKWIPAFAGMTVGVDSGLRWSDGGDRFGLSPE
ncbi:hypothetical protein [Pseudomonas sp. CGJS7]|uniref:hypothetical protein n=1 Tax=Pseudomonas sp. CGJS7 TaxID=3109348 RepID=UPI00300A9BD8